MEQSSLVKIAIHGKPGSFSDRWVEYCKEKRIPCSLVNCYASDIMHQLKSFDILLWHWHHGDPKAVLFARQFLLCAEKMGIKVFPNINTCWHFDDKVGQKYMLESIDAPLVPSYVFYDKQEALDWIENTDFPKVFKLRGGAGSMNVRLVKDRSKAKELCRVAFGRGFKANAGYFADFSTRIKKVTKASDYIAKLRSLPTSLLNIYLANKMRGRDKGYIYFQDFLANNKYDTRVTVVGNRAFAFRRMVRNNDFRASGSGQIDYETCKIDQRCVAIAFEVTDRLQSQSMAFDFVESEDSTPLILEVSYCYVAAAVKACAGYWDKTLAWHNGGMWPQDAILADILMEPSVKCH
jgi:glutathione synthase/RimK-type ligase-like ATP-grasp enzyme